MITASDAWKAAYPDARIGFLAMGNVTNPETHAALDARKVELEDELRARFAGMDKAALKALPVLQAYQAYYKRFDKTYHVLLQLESVALKGKAIPRAAALVETMFVAELKNQLLTAGHDLDQLQLPLKVDVAQGSESYLMLSGKEQLLKPGDMYIADQKGVLSSIIYGPDAHTRIQPATRRALFTVYAPQGIGEQRVIDHLRDIQAYVSLVSPAARVEQSGVIV